MTRESATALATSEHERLAERLLDLEGRARAIDRVQGVIEFDLSGQVLTSNNNFLSLMGYSLADVVGQHHRLFCEPQYAESAEYVNFWDRLRAGEFVEGEFKRLGRLGREVWIRASYNPIMGLDGKPQRIVKYAMDVTPVKLQAAEYHGKVNAISRAQAVIEFDLEGVVLDVNQNFLDLTGYSLDEVKGQHHRIFCDPDYARSAAYKQFWQKLGRGEFEGGEYKRLGKGGQRRLDPSHLQPHHGPQRPASEGGEVRDRHHCGQAQGQRI